MSAGNTQRKKIVSCSGIALMLFFFLLLTEKNKGTAEASSAFDPSTLAPFAAGKLYLGRYETGLYPGGRNEMPQAHRKAGERIAAAIRPLDTAGNPDDKGRIVALVFGHSNARQYFIAFQEHLKRNGDRLHPCFELLNAATAGQQLPEIRRLRGVVWYRANRLLREPGYRRRPLSGLPVLSPHQVQVLFLHTTYNPAGGDGRPPRPFPETMQRMRDDLAAVLEHCVKTYPNLRIAYLTCDGLRQYTGMEPHVWQEAFAFKWLIESQIEGEERTEFEDKDGKTRNLPWLCWGPYIWDNTWDRSYFTDAVHPAPKARDLFVQKYWEHLKKDSVAQLWMFRPAGKTRTFSRIINHEHVDQVATLPQAVMEAIGQQKWFFSHASLGQNSILHRGMEGLRQADSTRYQLGSSQVEPAFSPEPDPPPAPTLTGTVYHWPRGQTDWRGKLTMLDKAVRDRGWRFPEVDIVMDKLCFIDYQANATTYLSRIEALEKDYPDTIFVYVTLPLLRTDRDDRPEWRDANVQTNNYNRAVRDYCETHGKLLFDLADIEAHDPDGKEHTYVHDGETHQTLYTGYAQSSSNYLNDLGSQRAALGWYATAAVIASPPATSFEITALNTGGSEFCIGFSSSRPLHEHCVESRPDLIGGGPWAEISASIQNQGEGRFMATLALPSNRAEFYRVKSFQ